MHWPQGAADGWWRPVPTCRAGVAESDADGVWLDLNYFIRSYEEVGLSDMQTLNQKFLLVSSAQRLAHHPDLP